MNILCLLGLHKYEAREIHAVEKPDWPVFNAAIIQKCSRCNKSEITARALPTTIIVSTKYMDDK